MNITDQEFERAFNELLASLTQAQICSVPGVLSLLREEFNNDVIAIAVSHQDSINTPE